MRAVLGHKKMINTSKIYKMRVVFCVSEKAPKRLDILNAVRNMVLASGLDYVPAKVNMHWPRLSFGPFAEHGQIARREYIDIYLKTSVSAQEVRACLEHSRPPEILLIDVYRVPYSLAVLRQLATCAIYTIEGDFASFRPSQTIEEWATATHLQAVQQAANGMRLTTDIRPFVREARLLTEQRTELTLQRVEDRWINPLVCIYAWLEMDITTPFAELVDERFKVIREGLYWQDSAQNLHLI